MSDRYTVYFCGLLLGALAFSIDIMLPAFSAMADDLGAPYARVQLTIPFVIVAVGVSQLFMGPLSDRFGRKPVLMCGLVLYITGSLACTIASSIDWVLAGRVAQGLCISCAPVVGRAIIRDLSSGKELARNMALASMIFAFGPMVAPVVGATLMLFSGWRVIFMVMTVFGVFLLAVAMFALGETNQNRNAKATDIRLMARNTVRLFSHPVSGFNLVLSGVVMTTIMIILTNLPAVYDKEFGISGFWFAILFALHGLGIIAGQLANRRLIERYGVLATTVFSSICLAVVCAVMVAVTVAGFHSAFVYAGAMIVFALFYLVLYANTASLVLEHHGDIAGFASAVYGFTSQAISSGIAVALITIINGEALSFTWALMLFACLSAAGFLWQSRWNKSAIAP